MSWRDTFGFVLFVVSMISLAILALVDLWLLVWLWS